MFERKPKKHRRYLLYRVYVAIVYICGLVFVITWIATFASGGEPSALQIILFGILFPCFAVAVFMILRAFVFPFDFSIFGPFERTPFPNERPILEKTASWGQIGLFRGSVPFFSWYIYPSGLGVSILGIGKVFIPIQCIDALNEHGGSFLPGRRYELLHSSPEVRGPIYIRDTKVYKRLRSLYMKGTQHIHDN